MSEMLDQIRSLGDQLRWAAEADVSHIGTFSEILYAGMGGSGIAGDYAASIAAPAGTRVAVHKGYGPIPAWAIRVRPLVIAASYSGNTEETLDMVTSAWESGMPVATMTTGGRLGELTDQHKWASITVPGGLQPRAAAGYMIGAAVRLLEGAKSIDDHRLAFGEAADLADEMTKEGSAAWDQAQSIAAALEGRLPIIYGGGPVSSVVAQRWKTQINENAKVPAWFSQFPELDHNEIVGWETMPEMTSEHVAVVVLTDETDHDRVKSRISFTRDLTRDAVPWVEEVVSRGTSRLARLISLTVVGDLMSWMLADRLGVDPTPVATIEKLKKLLVQ
ncbi:MAG TPA: bifunctional phosphoglucose/phosphomannose isomerase [Acidimicrobiia bacterium]|jgi:glucose/mannose-6-phosphate isomerase|nr:bifunctional phosphoglucose/phosphomannose isomerase [Acidimicrobiia bacterium]